MKRLFACSLAGTVLLFAAACTDNGRSSGAVTPPRGTASGSASPRPSATSREDVAENARTQLLGTLSAKDLPGPAGMSTAAVAQRSALFVWRTGDGRLCAADAGSGFLVQSCMPAAGVPPVAIRPALVPVFTMDGAAEYHVIGADHETIVSVTCNGTPLRMRRLPRALDTGRALYVFEVPLQSVGRVTVTVDRAHAVTAEHADLIFTHHVQGRPVCR